MSLANRLGNQRDSRAGIPPPDVPGLTALEKDVALLCGTLKPNDVALLLEVSRNAVNETLSRARKKWKLSRSRERGTVV